MRFLLGLTIFALFIGLSGVSQAACPVVPSLSGWSNCRRITFSNASTTSEQLNNFPVLVQLNSSRIDYSKTQNSGQDIRFVDNDGSTLLDYEIERWDETASSSVWVRVPAVASSSATDYIDMFYGNAGAADAQASSAVWNANYKVVSHLTSNLYDSTSNNLPVSATGTTATSSGAIGGLARDFNGTTDAINLSSSSVVADIRPMTASIWHTTDDGTSAQNYFSKIASGNFWVFRDNVGASSNALQFRHNFTGGNGTWTWGSDTDPVVGQKYHILLTYDKSLATNDPILYINGILYTIVADGNASGSFSSEALKDLLLSSNGYDGRMDEFRYATSTFSHAWAWAEYQTGIGAFQTYGAEEATGASIQAIGKLVLQAGKLVLQAGKLLLQ